MHRVKPPKKATYLFTQGYSLVWEEKKRAKPIFMLGCGSKRHESFMLKGGNAWGMKELFPKMVSGKHTFRLDY